MRGWRTWVGDRLIGSHGVPVVGRRAAPLHPGDDNITVTFREPITGFPDGQDDNVALWAYVPQIVPEPASLVPMLLVPLLLAKKRYLR